MSARIPLGTTPKRQALEDGGIPTPMAPMLVCDRPPSAVA